LRITREGDLKYILSKVTELADKAHKACHGHAFQQPLGVISNCSAVELRVG